MHEAKRLSDAIRSLEDRYQKERIVHQYNQYLDNPGGQLLYREFVAFVQAICPSGALTASLASPISSSSLGENAIDPCALIPCVCAVAPNEVKRLWSAVYQALHGHKPYHPDAEEPNVRIGLSITSNGKPRYMRHHDIERASLTLASTSKAK
eukprot:7382116-Prymnesium_polylepis.2